MNIERKPHWLKSRIPAAVDYKAMNDLIAPGNLHTICTSGRCPNIGECWAARTASFMILGDVCTRSCRYCNVKSGRPLPPDPDEPRKLAATIAALELRHAVVTSVDRDDLPDSGAGHWSAAIKAIREACPGVTLETLIPDFDADPAKLDLVVEAGPEIISHNLETVERLTPGVRSRAQYRRSLAALRHLAQRGATTKSGIMVGLGETNDEVLRTMDDLLEAGCRIMTLGQYLRPAPQNLPVARYVTPEEFDEYRRAGLAKGFAHVESGPLVRSSYHAERHL